MFRDRVDAGRRLACALEKYRGSGALVLAIPRGGAVVGDEVARHLEADFSLVVSRKLPFPADPESGFGAIAEDGSVFIHEAAARWVARDEAEEIARAQRNEIRRRIRALRGGRPLPPIQGRTVILVDDGIAMGSTMRASIMLCRRAGAGRIVAAAPVAGPDVARAIGREADAAVILEIPEDFHAVAQAYADWHDLSDKEVLELMRRWEKPPNVARHGGETDRGGGGGGVRERVR